ncbi:YqgE/AlgH family protein [Marinobacter gelidimuriae]|uniref:YqgE/AlgH family protein n=1 Tax=Marinobacter gelidimuriae TaxID=2739064 RepID=UPI000374E63B|nr:YqgE/AlgH family protein [Marinobacter gelidimuriae]
MSDTANTTDNFRNHFLVASPWMSDPRFHGAVIYVCEHSAEGALGLTVNQPLDIHLGEILEQLDMRGGELDLPVFAGGPVQAERGFVLHNPGQRWQHTAEVTADIWLTTSRDILADIGAAKGPDEFLVALGYAGWGDGQLEAELGGNTWLTCPASPDLLFRTPWSRRYQAVLASMGIDINQLSETTGHA